MRILLAPDKFKGVLTAQQAADAMADGVWRADPKADVIFAPMADGGEGTLDCLLAAHSGQRRAMMAPGPLGEPVQVIVGLIDRAQTAVVELAQVAGYALVPADKRNPLLTSTYGLGKVLAVAIETGVERIILGIGGSATVDGGAGMMQGLGRTLYDSAGRVMLPGIGGGRLADIRRLVWDHAPPGIEHVQITIASDVLNPACGPNGAAAVFGPQKGADADAVRNLDAGLSHWTELLEDATGRRLRLEPGTGAAGGVALPLLALTNAVIVPGVDVVAEAVNLPAQIIGADLVLTGEGRLDRQSLMGKVVGAVARMSRAAGVPCVALVGAAGEGADECLTLLDRYATLDAPLDRTTARLTELAEDIVRRRVAR